jgi:hypothetical protein
MAIKDETVAASWPVSKIARNLLLRLSQKDQSLQPK